MRGVIVALTVCALMLSGCTGGSGLRGYIMTVGEAPEGCSLLPYDSEEGEFLRENFNWTGNPGRVDSEIFTEGNNSPVDNLVGLMECGEGEIASLVLRYASQSDLDAAMDDGGDASCDEEERFVTNGPILAFVEGDDDIPGMEDSLDAWAGRVVRQTGATDACGPRGNATA